jgi:hypothetical protein
MSSPVFLITDYIHKYPNFDEFRSEIFKKNIMSKDYLDEKLMLVYHKYDQPNTSDLERECRSIIIDKETKKILSYSCETPLMNNEALEYLLLNQNNNKIINKCYEGTLLSLFYKDKWFVSTRRCLNSQDSIWGNEQKSHFTMFMDVLNKSGYESFEMFTEKLDKNYCYYFILIHHQNKNIVDYETIFGKNYSKLVLAFVRDKDTQTEINLYEPDNKIYNQFLCNDIFVSEKLESLDSFDNDNQNNQFVIPPKEEGIIYKIFDESTHKYKLFKLQNKSYQFAKSVGSEKNMFMGLIYLYQKDKLMDYLDDKKNINLKKIVNPMNLHESYDSVGSIDALFKVCTSELFELFKILWDIKTGKHSNDSLYKLLPKEYKDVLFGIRGLYFKKKAESIQTKKIVFLQIKDIYQFLKSMSTETFCAFVKMRKLMYNWIKINTNLHDFNKISSKCDKIHFKLAAIYCNKLFPNIMPEDLPPVNVENN